MSLVTPLGIGRETCKAKVDNLDHSGFFFDKYVVELDVSMRYALGVEILESLGYLLEESSAGWLLHYPVRTMSLHIVVHTYAVYKVCYYAYLFLSFYQVMHFNDVWMVNFS